MSFVQDILLEAAKNHGPVPKSFANDFLIQPPTALMVTQIAVYFFSDILFKYLDLNKPLTLSELAELCEVEKDAIISLMATSILSHTRQGVEAALSPAEQEKLKDWTALIPEAINGTIEPPALTILEYTKFALLSNDYRSFFGMLFCAADKGQKMIGQLLNVVPLFPKTWVEFDVLPEIWDYISPDFPHYQFQKFGILIQQVEQVPVEDIKRGWDRFERYPVDQGTALAVAAMRERSSSEEDYAARLEQLDRAEKIFRCRIFGKHANQTLWLGDCFYGAEKLRRTSWNVTEQKATSENVELFMINPYVTEHMASNTLGFGASQDSDLAHLLSHVNRDFRVSSFEDFLQNLLDREMPHLRRLLGSAFGYQHNVLYNILKIVTKISLLTIYFTHLQGITLSGIKGPKASVRQQLKSKGKIPIDPVKYNLIEIGLDLETLINSAQKANKPLYEILENIRSYYKITEGEIKPKKF